MAAATFPIPDCNNATSLPLILPSKITALATRVSILSAIKFFKISTSCAIAPTIPIFITFVPVLFYLPKNLTLPRYNHRYKAYSP